MNQLKLKFDHFVNIKWAYIHLEYCKIKIKNICDFNMSIYIYTLYVNLMNA